MQQNIILKEHSSIITDDKEIFEIFNTCFSTIAASIGITDSINVTETHFIEEVLGRLCFSYCKNDASTRQASISFHEYGL